jgi:hypothetical protein
MSIYEFAACVDGYNTAHGGGTKGVNLGPPTPEQVAMYDDLVARLG